MLANSWGSFKGWLKKPFSTDMSALHWFLFIGLLIILNGLWAVILRHIGEDIA